MLGDRTLRHVEQHGGRLPLFGRYHKAPRELDNDYELTGTVLGSGASGDVRLGISRVQPSRRVAVKTFDLKYFTAEKLDELKSELKIMLCMDHPLIVRLLDVYESDETLDLVMECVKGGEIQETLRKRGQLREEEVSSIARQILLALSYLHTHGVVHRDLKLSNFVYDADINALKLIDFGLSKFFVSKRRVPRMHTCCGTLGYIAPEVLDGTYTSQCDMWSLGVIVYVLLAGEMPFADDDEDKLLLKTRAGQYRMRPDAWLGHSMHAMEFTQVLLRTDPEKRPTAAQALEHPWLKTSLATWNVSDSVPAALGSFCDKTPLRRCCMRMMVLSLSDDEIAGLPEAFLSLDTRLVGNLDEEQLEELLAQLELPEGKLQEAIHALDFSGDKSVHFSEFLAAHLAARAPSTLKEEHMRAAFRRFDREGAGTIRLEDLRAVAGHHALSDGKRAGELLSWLEASSGRCITYEQFAAYLTAEGKSGKHQACKACCVVQ